MQTTGTAGGYDWAGTSPQARDPDAVGACHPEGGPGDGAVGPAVADSSVLATDAVLQGSAALLQIEQLLGQGVFLLANILHCVNMRSKRTSRFYITYIDEKQSALTFVS